MVKITINSIALYSESQGFRIENEISPLRFNMKMKCVLIKRGMVNSNDFIIENDYVIKPHRVIYVTYLNEEWRSFKRKCQ